MQHLEGVVTGGDGLLGHGARLVLVLVLLLRPVGGATGMGLGAQRVGGVHRVGPPPSAQQGAPEGLPPRGRGEWRWSLIGPPGRAAPGPQGEPEVPEQTRHLIGSILGLTGGRNDGQISINSLVLFICCVEEGTGTGPHVTWTHRVSVMFLT